MFPILSHTPRSLYPCVCVCTSVCLLLDGELRLHPRLAQLFRVIRYSDTELNEFRFAGYIQSNFSCPRMLSQFVFVYALAFPVSLQVLMQWRIKTSVTKSWSSWSRTAEVYLTATRVERPVQKNVPPSYLWRCCHVLWTIYTPIHSVRCSLRSSGVLLDPLLSPDFLMSYPAVIDSSADLDR